MQTRTARNGRLLRMVLEALFLAFLFPVPCTGQVLKGTVVNGTSGRPASGDVVILLVRGLQQTQTVTEADGSFAITLPASMNERPFPLVLRAVHEDVSYDEVVSDSAPKKITVYDASLAVDHIAGYMTILQFQTRSAMVEITELHALRNDSNPSVTQVSPRNFEVTLPEGAQIESGSVVGPSEQPIPATLAPVAGQPNHFTVSFPLKPGLTRYAVVYQVPYKGALSFRRRFAYPAERISVVLPTTMRFRSEGPQAFHAAGEQPGTQVQTLDALPRNELLAFQISGSGLPSHAFQPIAPSASPFKSSIASSPAAARTNLAATHPPAARGNAAGAPASTTRTATSATAVPRAGAIQRMRVPSPHSDGLAAWLSLAVAASLALAAALWLFLSRRPRT